ncbi:MAG: MarR family transcriptional regulator [Kofleriaceae bacterium]|nr:MarR family transcriptional regulator [Kofleriaceae bacterium]
MNEPNAANLLGALAAMIGDGVRDAVAPDPGTLVERTALSVLFKYPDCSIEELRRPLALSHSGCVRLVDRLVAQGHVTRRTGADGRAVALRLTRSGRAVAAAGAEARAAYLLRLVRTLSPEERAALGRLATRLLDQGTPTPHAAATTCRLCDYDACRACPFRVR